MSPKTLPEGVHHWPGYLDRPAQEALVETIRTALADAPLFTPAMPRTGKPMSVRMTNLGEWGWVTDKEHGYRYQRDHPITGKPWPEMPAVFLRAWAELTGHPTPPQAALINWYAPGARMGLHQDRDEKDFSAPVLSLSLGDTALFRVGGTQRRDPTMSFRLGSGDAMMLAGPARLAFHGVDRVEVGTSDLLKNGGRINVTLRRIE